MQFWDQHKTITYYYEMITKSVYDKYQLTQMEYSILMFLHNNPQYATAADIVKIRKSTKSHVSTSLKSLEDKGLIRRVQSDENKKHVEIYLLDAAQQIIWDGEKAQKQFIKNIFQGLSEEEITICKTIFNKICTNAESCLNQKIEE